MAFDSIQKSLLKEVAGLEEIPNGAYNIRSNGALAGRNTTAYIDIVNKEDKPGIDIFIKKSDKKEETEDGILRRDRALFSGFAAR